jgi:hypothetical protein
MTNDVLDHAPALVRGNDGTLLLVWRQNGAGEMASTAANPDTLYYALWDGAAWSAPQVLLSDARNLLDLVAARHDASTMAVVYARDGDGDFGSDEDQELYQLTWNGSTWSSPGRLTDDAQPDIRPSLFFDSNGDPNLLWLKGNSLYAVLGDLAGTPQAIAVQGSSAILDYAAAQDNAGNLVLVWQGYSEEGVDVFYAAYDQSNGAFSLVEQLTHDQSLEKFMSPTFTPAGEMVMAYNEAHLVTETVEISPDLSIENVTTFGQTDLYILSHSFGPDLTLERSDLTVTPSHPAQGEMIQINATLHNTGDRAVVNPKVAFYHGDPDAGGTLIDTVTENLTLVGAMTTTVSTNWTVATGGGPIVVYAVADPDGSVVELGEANNTAHCFAVAPDLSVENVRFGYGRSQTITLTATLSNNGAVAATPVTVAFRLDDADSSITIVAGSVASLNDGETVDILVPWDASGIATDRYRLYAVADPADVLAEYDETNNSGWAGLSILPDLVLSRSGIAIGSSAGVSVSISVRNEGLRGANGVTLGIYESFPKPGTVALTSTTLNIPAGETRQATLYPNANPWVELYVGVGISDQFQDRNIADNVLVMERSRFPVFLPFILHAHSPPTG